MINGAALGVPRLPGVNEGAEVTATAPHESGVGVAAAPMPAAAATDGAVPAGAPAAATETAAPGLPPAPPLAMPPLYNPMMMMHNQFGGLAPGMPVMMQPGVGVPGGNPMMMPPAPGMMPPAPGMMMPPAPGVMPPGPPGFGPGSTGTAMEQAMLLQLSDMSRQRYGGTREEDVLIESFNVHGANRITVPMALAKRSSIPGEVAGDRAACDVKLRDTVMPGGIARKVEMVAAVLYDKEFFPGEPQIALFMAGRWSRADGFRPFMCQKMRGWAKPRSHAEDASMEVAAAGGTRGRAAIRNLPQFPPVTHMEPYENMVEGLLQLAEHAPDGMVCGMREFFSMQRTHYQACGDLDAMSYATLYTDLLDRFDEHAKAVHRMGIGVLSMVPALHALPTELASTMLLREQQLKSILTALRSSGVQARAAIAAVTDDKQKPPAKQPTGETRKEKREREAAERKAKQAAAGNGAEEAAAEEVAGEDRARHGRSPGRRRRGRSDGSVLQLHARRVQPRGVVPFQP